MRSSLHHGGGLLSLDGMGQFEFLFIGLDMAQGMVWTCLVYLHHRGVIIVHVALEHNKCTLEWMSHLCCPTKAHLRLVVRAKVHIVLSIFIWSFLL